jgi:ankyrin repeat protein
MGNPLHLAAAWGHLEVLRMLISQQANVNCRDSDGQTPLHYAARHGKADVADALIAVGAIPSTPDNYGLTAAQWARRANFHQLAIRLSGVDFLYQGL